MITLACPEESLPEWKELVAALGEHRAFISFFRNKYDIPREVERALELLGLDKTIWRSVDGKTLEQIKQEKAAAVAQKANAIPAKLATSVRLKVIKDERGTLIWSKDPAGHQSQPSSPKPHSTEKNSGRRNNCKSAVQPEFKI